MSPLSIGMIWAEAAGVIGSDGAIPWHIPEDIDHFKTVTADSSVIMGRRTWESIPARYRPLPGRLNIVMTRDPSWRAYGAIRASTVESAEAYAAAAGQPVWVIGGAQVYKNFLDRADHLEITEVEGLFAGKSLAPRVDPAVWRTGKHTDLVSTSTAGPRYRFCSYERRQHGASAGVSSAS